MRKLVFLLLGLMTVVFMGATCQKNSYDLGMYRSDDEGMTWAQKAKVGKSKKALASQEILSLVLDPQNSEIIYAGTKAKGVFKSYNSGEDWQKTSLTTGEFRSIAVNPEDSNVVYAAGYVGKFGVIFKSEDGGNNFEQIYAETHQGVPVYSLTIDWFDSRKIWAGTGSGAVLKSEDSGRNWLVKQWFNDIIMGIALSTLDSRHIIVGLRSGGLWETMDGGKEWKTINERFVDKKDTNRNDKILTYSLVYSATEKGTVYYSSKYQLLRSSDDAKTWEEINLLSRPEKSSLMEIGLDPFDSDKIYVSLDGNLYKSKDAGKKWEVAKITSGRITNIIVDPQNTSKVYLGVRKPLQ